MSGRPRSTMARSGGCWPAALSAGGVGGEGDVVAACGERDPQRPQQLVVVVDDQDVGHVAGRKADGHG